MAKVQERSPRRRRTHNLKPEVIAKQEPPTLPPGTHLKLAGYAILGKDQITQQPMWFTYNEEGEDHVNLSPSQPLIFPVRKLPPGTKVELFIPVSDDDNTQ